jgi:hypothetical protein
VHNGFSWIAVTEIKHQSTVHNMIVHRGGGFFLDSLPPCQQSFPVMYFLNPPNHDWKIALYIGNMYRLQIVEHAWLAGSAVDNGFSWIAVTKIEHQSTVLNMICIFFNGCSIVYVLYVLQSYTFRHFKNVNMSDFNLQSFILKILGPMLRGE